MYRGTTWIGQQQILNTTKLYAKLSMGIGPSTEYGITVSAYNSKGTGPSSDVLIAATLTRELARDQFNTRLFGTFPTQTVTTVRLYK